MFSDKSHTMKEEAHVGQELLESDPLSEMDRKCFTVKQVVQDGDFTLDEALALYQVSKSDYENFIVRSIVGEVEALFIALPESDHKSKMSLCIEVMSKMYKYWFISIDGKAPMILEHFDSLAKDVNEGKIAV